MIAFIGNVQNRQIHTDITQVVGCRSCGKGGTESDCLVGRVSFGVMKMVWNQTEVGIVQYCEYTKCHWEAIVCFKVVNFILGESQLNTLLLKNTSSRGTWVPQSVECLTSAQVMISQFVGSSPVSGSVLTAQRLGSAWDSVSPPLSLPRRSLFSLSKLNKY